MDIITRKEAREKGLKRYFMGKPCKYRHVCERRVDNYSCIKCSDARSRKWQIENPEKERERDRKYYADNQEREQERNRKWRTENPEKRRMCDRKWRTENPEKVREFSKKTGQKARANGMCEKHTSTPAVTKGRCKKCTIASRIRCLNRQILDNHGLRKSKSTQELTGCSSQDLYNHLIQTFHQNYPNSLLNPEANLHLLHIDHIKPVASFDLSDPEQLKQCFYFSNLQLLWGRENLAKSDKWEEVVCQAA